MPEPQSVTTWIGLLRDGDSDAARRLWERYFGQLVQFARGKLQGTNRRAADEEDVALSAFHSFCVAADRFPKLNDRQDLWQILVMLTARKAFQERRHQQTHKRGGAQGRTANPETAELDEIVGSEPTPEFAVLVAEQFHAHVNLLPDEDLRIIARMRLEERTNAEIAATLRVSERTVERKLALIRGFWEESSSA